MKSGYPRAVNFFLFVTAASLLTACATVPVKNQEELRVVSSRAQQGDKAALERLMVTLEPGKVKSPGLIAGALQQMKPFMKDPKAVMAVKPYLSSSDAEIRAAAFAAWVQARSFQNTAQFDRELTSQLSANESQYGRLTDEEYRAAGASDDPATLEFLKRNLGKYPEADPAIIRALGEIIARRRGPLAGPLPEGKGSDTDLVAEEAEEALTEYAGSEAEDSLRQLAIRTVEIANGPAGYERLLGKLSDRYLPLTVRMNILNYLALTEKERMEQRLAATLPAVKLWFPNEPEYLKRIDQVLAELNGTPLEPKKPAAKKPERKAIPVAKSILSPQIREQIARKDARGRIVSLFQKYKLNEELVVAMERHASSLVNAPHLKLDPASKLIFRALSRCNPQANYFELKKMAEQGFTIPGYYATVMKDVLHSGRDYEWQLLAIRRVWGVREDVAEVLHLMFRAEQPLF